MPFATRTARALATACLVVATLLTVLPAPAAALEPPRPLPGYHPRFVTQTDKRPWNDCLWASAAMLLDKWTNGDVRVTHQALRAKSGDTHGGSSFDEAKIAFAKYGFKLKFSPDGGVRITWTQMLRRLEKGAGAVLLGDDHKLPRWYGRWDYGFWKKKGKKDNHAVYIERYDRRHGRVWIMDPLARGDWKGEWISVRALRRFAWSSGGAMYVAMTPVARKAPFAKVKVSAPKLVLSTTALEASWSLKSPRRWRFPGATVKTAFDAAADPLLAAVVSPDVPVKTVAGQPQASVKTTASRKLLDVTAPLPTDPGAYVASVTLRDRRFGRVVAQVGDVAVFIPGERRATMRLLVRQGGVEAGSDLKVSVNVANTGTETWADTRTSGSSREATVRGTRVVAHWIPLDVAGTTGGSKDADAASATPDPIVLRTVPLAPGRMVVVRELIATPELPGRWALVVDVEDDIDGSFAALGSEPVVHELDVVTARGKDPIE